MSLHVYAACCAWHGSIYEAASSTIPVCPHCGSPLFQIEEDKWKDGAIAHEAKGHTHYVEFLEWVNKAPRCWRDLQTAAVAFLNATGKRVVLKLPEAVR